ncbi:hypothetical protein C3489_32000 [Streptomyces sp. Ru71]|uniref:hypothetical protein n=1 Tax=Streptomyces sp. Ru71 TaxID=2080746 RepID=UPI000CDDE473|nr:hypothetical protein [Streptomyces sp. Ru71]POX46401.1 hypothetical protein C3489_32000 [Streptomyces sp. Ru71]
MQLYEEDDTRKVQTAVVGHPGSDEPVFLPFDHGEFPDFVARYPDREFYCGSLLGGCGKRLSAKRYTSKKCHFAHHPPVRCRRTANNESSADHLYIGQAFKRWLQQQGQRDVTVSYDLFDADSAGCITISFDRGCRTVRVQLDRMEWKPWLVARKKLNRRTRGKADWVYGPESMLAHNEVDATGYALRVQCRTVGSTREVRIGTQVPGHTIEWTTLDRCRLADSKIITPSLEETDDGIQVSGPRPASAPPPPAATRPSSTPPELIQPVAFQLAPGTVSFTGAVPVDQARGDRCLYDAVVQSTGFAVTSARISLPTGVAVPDHDQLWVLLGPITLQLPAPGLRGQQAVTCVITAENIARLEGTAQELWLGLRPRAVAPPSTASANVADQTAHSPASPSPATPPNPASPSISPAPSIPEPRTQPAAPSAAHQTQPSVKPSGAEKEARAALDALLDQSREAREAGNWGAVRQTAGYLAMLRDNPTVVAAVRSEAAAEYDVLSGWTGERTVSGHQLGHLLQRLRDEGETLPLAALRRLVEDAEAEADRLDRYLTADEIAELCRWRDELARRSGRLTLDALERLGDRVRSVLESYARAGSLIPWATLSDEVGGILRDLHPDDQVEALVQADRTTTDDEPPISALVTDDDSHMHPFFPQILDYLDRPVSSEADLPGQWSAAVQELYRVWSRH